MMDRLAAATEAASGTATEAAKPVSRPRNRAVARAYCIEDLRNLARRRLPHAVFDLFDGGAEDEDTLRANRTAFDRARLLPKVLVDVSRVDARTTILGGPAQLPIAVAPTGAVGFGWRGGDVAIARAASAYGIPYTLSTSATASIERVAREAPGRLWFQAYIFRKREFTLHLIERARDAGYEALMITVDLPVGGKRERDFRNDLSLPFRITRRNFFGFASRPAWALDMLLRGPPVMENVVGYTPEKVSSTGLLSVAGRNNDPSFDWDGLKAVRDAWPRKLIVKGIVRPDDAERLAAIGGDAVVVSNHGGRQLDGAVATLDALPPIARAVGGRISVMMDGGIRRGAHVMKALALGAEAVLIGRATLYGVCAAGEAGALRALEILRDEFMRSMQLCGARTVSEIGRDLVFREGLWA
jgi:(S)-mandelate dehydrogenase